MTSRGMFGRGEELSHVNEKQFAGFVPTRQAEPNTHFTHEDGRTQVYGDTGRLQGLYDPGEIEGVAAGYRDDPGGWPEAEWATKPSQGMLFDPNEIESSEYQNRRRAIEGMRISFGSIEGERGVYAHDEDFAENAKASLANSRVPISDLQKWSEKPYPTITGSTGAASRELPSSGLAYSDTGDVRLNLGESGEHKPAIPSVGSAAHTVTVHEVGHQVHMPVDLRNMYSRNPDPTLEGVADGYSDRYSHPRFKRKNNLYSEYAIAKSWTPQDVSRYLTTRASVRDEGMIGFAPEGQTRRMLGRPKMSSDDPLIQKAAEVHPALAHDRTSNLTKQATPPEEATAERVNRYMQMSDDAYTRGSEGTVEQLSLFGKTKKAP